MESQLIDQSLVKQAEEAAKESESLAVSLRVVKIISGEGYQLACERRIAINKRLKLLDGLRLELTRPLLELKRKWDGFFQIPIDQLKTAKIKLDSVILEYEEEAEKKRLAEEAKARDEARKKEEAEKKKLDAKAAKAEAAGNTEKAEELRQQKENVYVPPAVIQANLPKTKLQTRDNWTFEIVDEKSIPREYLTVDTVKLGNIAKTMKDTFGIPGVKFINKPIKAG